MPNKLREDNKPKRVDDNFLVIQDTSYGRDHVLVNCLVNKSQTSYEALAGFIFLLDNNAQFFRDSYGRFLNKVEDYEGNDVRISCTDLGCCYLVSLSTSAIYSPDKKGRNKQSIVLSKQLKKLINKGLNKDEKSYKRLLTYVENYYAYLKNQPLWNLQRLVRINFADKYPLGAYIYGNFDKLKNLRHVEFDREIKVLNEADHLDVFIGYPEYVTVLALRKAFKPSSKLLYNPELPIILGSEKHLNALSIDEDSYLACIYKIPYVRAEKLYWLQKILNFLLSDKDFGLLSQEAYVHKGQLLDSFSYFSGGLMCFFFRGKEIAAMKDYFGHFLFNMDVSAQMDLISRIKERLIYRLNKGEETIEKQARAMAERTILNISNNVPKLTFTLESITEEDVVSYIKSIAYMGEIVMEGK